MCKKDLQTAFSTRQYMYSRDFEVYYYSDVTHTGVSPHEHDYYEFYFFMEGNVDIHVADQTYHIRSGDFLLIPPHVTHYPVFLDEQTPYRRFVLWVSASYAATLTRESADYGYLQRLVAETGQYCFSNDIITFNRIQSQLFDLIAEVKGTRFGREAQLGLLVNSLLLYLNRLIYERSHIAGNVRQDELPAALCDYINAHLGEDLSLERLEREIFVSKYYLSHTFKEAIGLSLHQYISKKRLQACRSAICSGASVSRTCALYGFGDYTSFYRAFKKEYGISPKEYQAITASPHGTP